MMFGLKRISTAFGLLAVMAGTASAQMVAPNANQMTADAVAGSLRASQSLAGYRIEIQARSGLVTLTGSLGNAAQKAEALARAQQTAGVLGVVDGLQVSGDQIMPVQYQPQLALGHRGGYAGGSVYDAGTGMGAPAAATGGPLPEGPAGMTGGAQASMPGAPNYAWPSYAPYPNFSAVGYPTAYPWQAWPNIGPFYPYPEVPLDWRAVTLRWDDGIWWLDFKRNYTRPFITPYLFGIWAY
jgi:hypothetical protein